MIKKQLHPRNRHRSTYDFEHLLKYVPALKAFLSHNPKGQATLDFAHPQAVKLLNQALLYAYYGLTYWDLPAGYLCPPIPGRVDYLHYLADLLAQHNAGKIPRGQRIRCLDIGVGANLIYPILGRAEYAWSFVGTELDPQAIAAAQALLKLNPTLTNKIELRLQTQPQAIFQQIIQREDYFDLTLCNPPFHASSEAAQKSAQRKIKNLHGKVALSASSPNFGGQANELYYPGGEIAFLRKMINQSQSFATNCYWFTSLVSKKANLPLLYKALKKVKARQIETINMRQGNKQSRFVAWTFLSPPQRKVWQSARWS